jgi:membrane-associated phospholipid phosphatase
MCIATWANRPHQRRIRPRTTLTVLAWLLFALQLLLIEAFELGDDILRGNLDPPNPAEAVRHAQSLVSLERAHGLFIEPMVQLWAQHLHAFSGLVTYRTIVQATDVIYAAGQTIVPLLLAVWIFRSHRTHWALIRTTAFLTVLFCVIGYELYPVAPPRLTTGLEFAGRAFHFQNTVQHIIGDGKLNGIPIGYNAYSAMPSAHMAMALLVAGSVVLLSTTLVLRLVAGLYPILMLFTIVVSGNHYLLDAGGGLLVVMLAGMSALALEPGHRHLALLRARILPALPDERGAPESSALYDYQERRSA